MGSKSKIVGIFIAAVLILSAFSGSGIAQDQERPVVPVSVIIGFEDSPPDEVRVLVEAHGGTVKVVWDIIPAMAATLPPKAIEAIQNSPNVAYVEEDAMVYALGKPASPPGQDKQKKEQPPQELPWGVDQIDAELAWNDSTGAGVKVAVLDTGIDYKHPDLNDNVKGGVSVVGLIETTNPRLWTDKNGHGTHCAGIIAAENNDIGVVGVAPGASLYAVKVLRNDGSGTYSDVIDGIQWSVDNGMQVISMSFGGASDSRALKAACDAAADNAGLILVAAAGNNGDGDSATDEISYPAAYDSVIAVGATDESDVAPYWSNSGPYLELAAPGVDIKSTWLDESYETHSGTSMSCPHISGTAALVLADNPILSNSDVRAVLQTTADPLGDTRVYGYGLVDAEESVIIA